MEEILRPHMVMIIVFAALATYVTRFGGYVLITRMKRIPPRVEAALNAVPAAVLATLVAPAAVTGGTNVAITLVAAGLVGLRFGMMPMLAAGWAVVMALRHLIG